MQDLTGQKFGMLTVIDFSHKEKNHYYWKCECECGNICIKNGSNLKSGSTKSCGCLHDTLPIKHNLSSSKIYFVYHAIKWRCYNPKYKTYHRYGGRGITMCDEWLKDFMNFYNWAMANGYKDGLWIERIDNNGNYEPSNCKWATRQEQCQNREQTIKITYNGQTHCLTEWARITGINFYTLQSRYKKGWDVEKMLTTKARKMKKKTFEEG